MTPCPKRTGSHQTNLHHLTPFERVGPRRIGFMIGFINSPGWVTLTASVPLPQFQLRLRVACEATTRDAPLCTRRM
eukprot:5007606-Amphidinium_carterae.1